MLSKSLKASVQMSKYSVGSVLLFFVVLNMPAQITKVNLGSASAEQIDEVSLEELRKQGIQWARAASEIAHQYKPSDPPRDGEADIYDKLWLLGDIIEAQGLLGDVEGLKLTEERLLASLSGFPVEARGFSEIAIARGWAAAGNWDKAKATAWNIPMIGDRQNAVAAVAMFQGLAGERGLMLETLEPLYVEIQRYNARLRNPTEREGLGEQWAMIIANQAMGGDIEGALEQAGNINDSMVRQEVDRALVSSLAASSREADRALADDILGRLTTLADAERRKEEMERGRGIPDDYPSSLIARIDLAAGYSALGDWDAVEAQLDAYGNHELLLEAFCMAAWHSTSRTPEVVERKRALWNGAKQQAADLETQGSKMFHMNALASVAMGYLNDDTGRLARSYLDEQTDDILRASVLSGMAWGAEHLVNDTDD
ncbi:MAG: hypothetical protein AAGI68_06750 [Planctomycetota bacterium]